MDPAHISRLKEEQEIAYQDTQDKISQWKKFDDDYSSLQDRLKSLPDKVSHPVMVPFGKLAFMPGEIIHTNEITVLLGDNWFAERSAKQACEIIDRRKEQIQKSLSDLEEQKRLLGDRLGFTSEFKEISENKEGIVDIQEEYDPEKERRWREERKKKKQMKTTISEDSSKPPSKPQHMNDKDSTKEKAIKNSDRSPVQFQKQVETTRTKGKSHVKHESKEGESDKIKKQTLVKDERKEGESGKIKKQTLVKEKSKEGESGTIKQQTGTEEERLWARLDELERQEEELDEMARLSDYDEDGEEDSQPMFSFAHEEAPEESKTPKKQLSRSNSVEKRVQWKDQQDSASATGSSCGSDDEEIVTSTIHFKHTKTESQQIPPSNSSELTSPADIYHQYQAMQPLHGDSQPSEKPSVIAEPRHPKSILKPSPLQPEVIVEKPPKQILPQLDEVFSGNIVERNFMAAPSANEPPSDQPPKRVSKFKAGRQHKR